MSIGALVLSLFCAFLIGASDILVDEFGSKRARTVRYLLAVCMVLFGTLSQVLR